MSPATKLCRKTKTTMVPHAKASVAQSEMRQAALRIAGLPVFEDIAHTSHGPNQRLLPRAVNLAAQPVNMHVNHVGVRLNAHPPHLVQNHRSRDHASRIPAQILQK